MTKKKKIHSIYVSSNIKAASCDRGEAAGVCSRYRALNYWIRYYCMPGKIDPANAECARGSEMAALNDLKRLLGFGTIGDFVTLAATYCRVTGGPTEEEEERDAK